jgi:hypothetical protein
MWRLIPLFVGRGIAEGALLFNEQVVGLYNRLAILLLAAIAWVLVGYWCAANGYPEGTVAIFFAFALVTWIVSFQPKYDVFVALAGGAFRIITGPDRKNIPAGMEDFIERYVNLVFWFSCISSVALFYAFTWPVYWSPWDIFPILAGIMVILIVMKQFGYNGAFWKKVFMYYYPVVVTVVMAFSTLPPSMLIFVGIPTWITEHHPEYRLLDSINRDVEEERTAVRTEGLQVVRDSRGKATLSTEKEKVVVAAVTYQPKFAPKAQELIDKMATEREANSLPSRVGNWYEDHMYRKTVLHAITSYNDQSVCGDIKDGTWRWRLGATYGASSIGDDGKPTDRTKNLNAFMAVDGTPEKGTATVSGGCAKLTFPSVNATAKGRQLAANVPAVFIFETP